MLLMVPGRAVQAQSDPLNEAWRWAHYGVEAGLPSEQVYDLVETSDGLVWANTLKGLAWYDGFRWHAVGHAENAPLQQISGLVPDRDGNVLFKFRNQWHRGNQYGFNAFFATQGRDTLVINTILPFNAGELLLRTSDDLYSHRDATLHAFPLPASIDPLTPYTLWRTKQGSLWISAPAGAFEWTGEAWLRRFEHEFTFLYEDSKGGILAEERQSSEMGLWTWTPDAQPTRRDETLLPLITAIDVNTQREGIAVYSTGAVRILRERQWRWQASVPKPLADPQAVLLQHNGNLWVAHPEGLSLYRGGVKRWHRWRDDGLTDGERIQELLQTTTGDLWVAAGSGVYIHRANGTTEHLTTIGDTALEIITGLAEDREGGVWISSGESFAGAFRLFQNTWTYYGPDDGLDAPKVHKIVPDRQGRLWFLGISSVYGGSPDEPEPGAFAYDGQRFTRWGPDEGLLHGRVYAFTEDHDGGLWFGTLYGLSRWKNGQWTHWTRDQGLAGQRVFALATAPDGRVWLGQTDLSPTLGYIDEQDRVVYPAAAELARLSKINDLRFGPDSTLWIATVNGLWRFRDGIASQFGLSAGLRPVRMWPVLPLADQVLIGTTGGGVVGLGLEEARHPAPFVQNAAPIVEANAVHLRWQVFAYQGELLPNRIETRYRLDNEPWSAWNTSRDLDVRNLSPGQHIFTVQAKSLFGAVDTPGRHTTFQIAPPFYRHPLFLTALLLWLGSLAGLGISYWRKQRHLLTEVASKNEELKTKNIELETHNAELERFTYTVSHDLKSPLVTIKGFLGLLRQDAAAGDTQRMERDIEQIAAAADTMGQLLSELLELSRIGHQMNPPEEISLTDLAHEAAALVAVQIKEAGVVVEIDRKMPKVYGDRMRLLEVYQNLIDNAVKFMGDQPGPRIEVGAQQRDGETIFYVRDNGIGIDPPYHENVFGLFNRLNQDTEGTGIGLALVRRIVEVHEGRIWVESEGDGHGSTFCFTLPLCA